jgi:hypothetical protein
VVHFGCEGIRLGVGLRAEFGVEVGDEVAGGCNGTEMCWPRRSDDMLMKGQVSLREPSE